MNGLSSALAVLTAMITPAVLISACGTMILSTSTRLLQRAMMVFYVALGVFVSTSVAIGLVAVTGAKYYIIPVITGLIGACFLFYGSILLIFEARLALSTIHTEMDFIWRLSQRLAPAELVEKHKPHFVHFRKHEKS